MPKKSKKPKIKTSKEIKKDNYTRLNITATQEVLENYEFLKEEFGIKTFSGMVRYTFKLVKDNINLFKNISNPFPTEDQSTEELIQIITNLREKEKKENLENENQLTSTLQQLSNQVEKISNYLERKDPEVFKEVKSEINGLGGKL